MSEPSSTLSTLVPTTPSLLAYTIPLLIVSFPLTFAGTFLTLDRSRSFPSSYASVPLPGTFDGPKKLSKFKFSLQGGIGGLASGYVFGVHLSTFLSLLVPAVSSSAGLSANSFLAVWILSCISTTILGGRYWYCARIFSAISGGSLLALAISVVIHPPLLPRQILTGLFAALSLVITLIFSLPALTQLLRPMSRILTASSGAFSLVLSIALLAHIPAWADIWERLWLHDGESWGTSKEKGLSATYFILFGVGIAVDYALNRWLGECPDEKWDHFLANYSANLPNNSDRAGSFRPLPIKSLWGRLFATQAYMDKKDEISPLSPFKDHSRNSITKDPVLFSDDEYDKDFATNPHLVHDLPYDDLLSPSSSPAFLKKARSQTTKFKPHKRARGFQDITRGRKQPVKFGQDLSSDSSGDDSDAPHQKVRPWLKQKASMSSSTPTLVDQPARTLLNARNIDLETVKHKKARTKHASGPSVTPVYSDYEEDIATPSPTPGINEEGTGWRPEFIRRYSSSTGVSGLTSSASGHSSAPMGAVPATPSLIKALDRITAAQRDAFGSISVHSAPSPNQSSSKPETKASSAKVDGLLKVKEVEGEYSDGDPDIEVGRKEQLAPGWDEFWREVKHKAAT